MQATRAVVLARGAGSRMKRADGEAGLDDAQRRAADAGHKAMMPMGGRPFLDFVVSSLADAGYTDIALIVAPEHEEIRRYYMGEGPPQRVRLSFLVQQEPVGTANATLAIEPWAQGEPFIVLNADNLYPVESLRALRALEGPGLLVFERGDLIASSNIPQERVAAFAIIEVDATGRLACIVEKPGADAAAAAGPHALLSMNCWRFDSRIFPACRDVERSPRGEFELPLAVALAIERGVRFSAVPARGPVLDLSSRSDVAEVARRLAGVEVRT
jgi:glucose-1-phosphate thymidylyltransferase